MTGFFLLNLLAAASTLFQADPITVEAYVSGITPQMSSPVVYGAEYKAGRILKKSGILISWRHGRRENCNATATRRVYIEFVDAAPDSASKMALATTYKDSCPAAKIRVFWDRISRLLNAYPLLDRALVGNVLAHEITHSMQKSPVHEETGMMKAFWEFDDIQELTKPPKKNEDGR